MKNNELSKSFYQSLFRGELDVMEEPEVGKF